MSEPTADTYNYPTKSVLKVKRTCTQCSKEFVGRAQHKLCSTKCRIDYAETMKLSRRAKVKAVEDNTGKCEVCGKGFKGLPSQAFCSTKCRKTYEGASYVSQGIAAGNLGAAHELIVCADLLKKGWYVFRAVGPHGPCDLVGMKNGVLHKIEVKTASVSLHGSHTREVSNRDYDIKAFVYAYDNTVTYDPVLPS